MTPQNLTYLMTAIAILLVVAAALVISWAVYWDYRKKLLEREERRMMIEKGLTPPPIFAGNWPQVKQHEQQLRYEERRLMIEKGMELPQTQPLTRQDYLRRGILFFLGIGLEAGYFVVEIPDTEAQEFLGVAGLAVGLLGLGYIIYCVTIGKDRGLEEGRATDRS
jgi:hypothetical protein